MCGIVGAIAQRDIAPILLAGLKRLEYRGYDSAGIAVVDTQSRALKRLRTLGKVAQLDTAMQQHPLLGHVGIAHTRWATHGQPSESNAHPHFSGEKIAVVHNGIIENHETLHNQLVDKQFNFISETDTEVIAHTIAKHVGTDCDILSAVFAATAEFEGAYALGILTTTDPNRLIAVRKGSPLVVGLGIGENFIASDHLALLPVTQKFIFLEEGDVADIRLDKVTIYDTQRQEVLRPIHESEFSEDATGLNGYRHYMLKEIYDQPKAVAATLEGRIGHQGILDQAFGSKATQVFDKVQHIEIIACGTSYHAGLIGKYWLEALAKIPCHVEIASEYRYRQSALQPNTLFVALSQSGETADILAALKKAQELDYLATLAICNVAESSLVRQSDLVLLTRAGIEVGVASTKAFTTQLVSLMLLTLALSKRTANNTPQQQIIQQLLRLPTLIEEVLTLDPSIHQLATHFVSKQHTLFLGRGTHYPVALEGALKLKEISYIHAEGYPAGELKHGPLALVDENMPVVVVAPNDILLAKLKSNLNEVRARGGALFVFADQAAQFTNSTGVVIVDMPSVAPETAPIVYTIPLQLLAYHVAVLKGTDVDKPRNLAKSVTVE